MLSNAGLFLCFLVGFGEGEMNTHLKLSVHLYITLSGFQTWVKTSTKANVHVGVQMINHTSSHIGLLSIGKQPAAYLASTPVLS